MLISKGILKASSFLETVCIKGVLQHFRQASVTHMNTVKHRHLCFCVGFLYLLAIPCSLAA